MKLSIISPAYNEEEVLPYFLGRAQKVCQTLIDNGVITEYEILIVDDGSHDDTWVIIKEHNEKNANIKGIKLSRNFGHHAAIAAGLEHAEGDFIVYLDSDLQAQPEDIPEILNELKSGHDMVWGVASKRGDDLPTIFLSKLFYWIFNRISGVKIPSDPVIAGCNRRAALNIRKLSEVRRFSLAQWTYVGFDTAIIQVEKKARYRGTEKYNFLKRLGLATTGITGFSTFPLKISSFIGFLMSFLGMALGAFIIYRKLVYNIPVAGYASLFATITFFFGVHFLILGIIGEYVGIIIDEVKKRPIYIIAEVTE